MVAFSHELNSRACFLPSFLHSISQFLLVRMRGDASGEASKWRDLALIYDEVEGVIIIVKEISRDFAGGNYFLTLFNKHSLDCFNCHNFHGFNTDFK